MNSQKSLFYFKIDLDTDANAFYMGLRNHFESDAGLAKLGDREFILSLNGSLGDIVDDSYTQGDAAAAVEGFVFGYTNWGGFRLSNHIGFLVGAAEYKSDIKSATREARETTVSVNYVSKGNGPSGRVPRRIVKAETPEFISAQAV